MFDIIADKKLAKHVEKRGDEALIIGKDVILIKERKEIKKHAALIILGTKNERNLIEAPIDGVTRLESNEKKDHLHFRKAGLDQVTGNILGQDKKALIIGYTDIKEAKEPAKILGRTIQNIQVAKKNNVPVILASYAKKKADLHDYNTLIDFYSAMGADKQALVDGKKAAQAWLDRAKHRASEEYVAEGVKRVKNTK